MRRRNSRCPASSMSGPAVSCRRATARTCTAPTTRTTGRCSPTASRTAIRSSSRAAHNGVMYWGQFDKVKVSGGAFDGKSADGEHDNVISAGRVQVDFWDPEARLLPERHLLRRQEPARHRPRGPGPGRRRCGQHGLRPLDFLLEQKVKAAAPIRSRAEWANYSRLGGYNANYGSDDGGYVLGSFLFPRHAGPGQFEVLGKFAQANFSERPERRRHGLRPEDDRAQLQLRHQGVQRARDDVLQGHALQRRPDQLQAVRRRPPDADVTDASARVPHTIDSCPFRSPRRVEP